MTGGESAGFLHFGRGGKGDKKILSINVGFLKNKGRKKRGERENQREG